MQLTKKQKQPTSVVKHIFRSSKTLLDKKGDYKVSWNPVIYDQKTALRTLG